MAQGTQALRAAALPLRDEILRDSVLPCDLIPRGYAPHDLTRVLVTGAAGFLGRYVVTTLLEETDWDVVCLVRAADDDAATRRVLETLALTGRRLENIANRVTVFRGDVTQPRLGLTPSAYRALSENVSRVIHCAAEVNWIKSYTGLRSSNVLGTLNTVEFACHGNAKPFTFASTLAVCYAIDSPPQVTEDTDMAEYVEGMPLGYAQTKCVSETLLRQAAERGLPVTVVRPSLICGDSVTGRSNEEDLISRLLKGCATLGYAADVDWQLDCCPVDHVARVLATLSREPARGFRALHVHHSQPRHWRELVLWMNLYGYSIGLLEFDSWLDHLKQATRHLMPSLYALRAFFLARPEMLEGRYLPELYLEPTRRRIGSENSHAALEQRCLTAPDLDTHLLNRYFGQFAASGYMTPTRATYPPHPPTHDIALMQTLLRQYHADPELTVLEYRKRSIGAHGLISELGSARSHRETGIWHYQVRYRLSGDDTPTELPLVVKIKPADHLVQQVAETVARLHSAELGRLVEEHPNALGSVGAHRRELAVYESADPRLVQYLPRVYATSADETNGTWSIAMEHLDDVELINSADAPDGWSEEHICCAIRALGDLHAVWYGNERGLMQQGWLAEGCDGEAMINATPLWKALAIQSAPYFSEWIGEPTLTIQQRTIATIPHWWQQVQKLPRTLIHNDFNPRNLAFRRRASELQLCAYDWELATLGLPQYDLAELLCFVLPASTNDREVSRYLELHRLSLEGAASRRICPYSWRQGFSLALRQLLVCRLPTYTLVEKFKPQPFLPRVLRNWHRLYSSFESLVDSK